MPTEARGISATALALQDLAEGFTYWPLWGLMGWQDIKQRYRRSLLGQFWLTLSMGILVGSLGVLYGVLFSVPIDDYLPFLALGFLAWGLISGIINEGCTAFIDPEHFIKQVKLPFSVFVFRVIWRNLVIFAHNFVIYVLVAVVFGIWPGAAGLLFLPGLMLVATNALWIGLLFGPTHGLVRRDGHVSALFDATLGMDLEATGYENIRLRGLFLGLSPSEISGRTEDIAAFTELGDYLYMPARTYSSGMMLRLAFAVSTCIDPEILLLDEWLAVGDAQFLEKAERRMQTLIDRSGILVIASHSPDLIRRTCTKAILLDHGQMASIGGVNQVLKAYEANAAA